jgi:hypothetical protein
MTQDNLKAGLRRFGDIEKTTAMEEMTQLHIMDTWKVMDPADLSQEEWMRVLSSLLFLKEKCTGKIKGRACLNRAPQCTYIPKEDTASPTVSTESTFITSTIAVKEWQRVRCYNVPSAFVTKTLYVKLQKEEGPIRSHEGKSAVLLQVKKGV